MSRSNKSKFSHGVPTHRPTKISRWDAAECCNPSGKRKLKAFRRRQERRSNREVPAE